MSNPIPTYHYDYRFLDTLLKEDIPPEECWQVLDETLQVLVICLGHNPVPPVEQTAELYSRVRILRDIFKELKPLS